MERGWCVALTIALAFLLSGDDGVQCQSQGFLKLSRSSFPDGFVFGAASSAYQVSDATLTRCFSMHPRKKTKNLTGFRPLLDLIMNKYEGATNTDGKKPSIWDTFTRLYPEKIEDHSTGNVADNFYQLFKEDVALMKEIGLDSYRFSLSWPRILPEGKISKGINWKGVDFYDRLIDELLLNGIQPFVTIFHWDVPQTLENEYGGFLSPKIVDDFRDYADFCFQVFGDKVKSWITINEPNIFSMTGYAEGIDAPGRCSNYIGNCTSGNSATEPYIVVHHMLLSHGVVVNLYREKYQELIQNSENGRIGITINTDWWVPKYQTNASRSAASRALDFMLGWILHPLTYGEYPGSMQYIVGKRLPKFTKSESNMVKGSLDFLGINYYSAGYADDVSSYSKVNLSYTTDWRVTISYEKDGIPIGEPTALSWLYVYPNGIRELLLYVKRNYKGPTIYITENGMGDANNNSLPLNEALNDSLKMKYYQQHLSYLLKSIEEGVDVKGYYIWSFLDNFEWNDGYTIRFGITYVDYENGLKRYMKKSALWFKRFLQNENCSLLYSE